MKPIVAALLGSLAGLLAACVLGIPLRLIVDLGLPQPELSGVTVQTLRLNWIGLSGDLLLLAPPGSNHGLSAWSVSQVAILMVESVAAGFLGGLVSALVCRSCRIPIAILTFFPGAALLIALRHDAVAGEAASFFAVLLGLMSAAFAPLAAQKWPRKVAH